MSTIPFIWAALWDKVLQCGGILINRYIPLIRLVDIEFRPDIVDADQDRKPIWFQVQNVGLPAGSQITYSVAGDTPVEDADVLLWVSGSKLVMDEFDIAITEGVANDFGGRADAPQSVIESPIISSMLLG